MIVHPHTGWPPCWKATLLAALGPKGPTLIIFTLSLSILQANTTLSPPQPLYACLFAVLIWVQLYAPLFQVPASAPSSPMQTAAIATDTPRPPSRWHMCLCDPVVYFPISSALTSFYFFSLIIISLFPLSYGYLRALHFYLAHSTWSPTLGHSIVLDSHPPTDTSHGDCLHLAQ